MTQKKDVLKYVAESIISTLVNANKLMIQKATWNYVMTSVLMALVIDFLLNFKQKQQNRSV